MENIVTKHRTSIRSLVQGFILCQRTEGKSPRTVVYYEGILRRFLWYAEKEGWPDQAQLLSEWQLRDFLGYLSSSDNRWGNKSKNCQIEASHSTLRHYYIGLHAFFGWCVREGLIEESPLSKIKVHKAKSRVIQPYTFSEIQAMLKVCELDYQRGAKFIASRNRAIILILLDSGLRLREISSIKLTDIDTNNGWIKVQGKGGKERVVRIGKYAQKALWTHLTWRPEGYSELWLTEEGHPLAPRGIQHVIRAVKKRAGVMTEGSVHRFRHTFSLNFLRADRNPFNLQYLLGHSSLDMVRRYTATLGMEDALKAHENASPVDMLGLK
jgi:site-specific recombinase XerD